MTPRVHRRQLVHAAGQSLRWIETHLDDFRLRSDDVRGVRLKALDELTMASAPLLRWIGRTSIENQPARTLERIRELAWREATGSVARGLFEKLPQSRIQVIRPYLALRDDFERVPELEHLVQDAIRVDSVRFESEVLRYRSGLLTDPHVYSIFARIRIDHAPRFSEADAYAVTRAILFATEFGRRPLVLSPVRREAIIRVLNELTLRFARDGFIDLLGELLLCLRMLGAASAAYDFGASTFLSAANENGSTSAHVPERTAQHTDEFARRYHPTLVALLFSCCDLASNLWA